VRRLEKPDFRVGSFCWVDSDCLPEPLRTSLRAEAAHSRLSDEAVTTLIRCAAEAAQMAAEDRNKNTPAAEVQRELEASAGQARALLHALSKLTPGTVSGFSAHWDYLAFGSEPPEELCDLSKAMRFEEGRYLAALWEVVQDFEVSARYAAGQCRPSRQAQTGRHCARALVRTVADEFWRLAGHAPPYSKETWFPRFMALLCGWPPLDIPCGRSLVESTIRGMPPPV